MLQVDPDDPCAFLTPGHVEIALGVDVRAEREAESHEDPQGNSVPLCIYETARPFTSLSVFIDTPVTASEYRGPYERNPLNTKPVSDIVDLAFIDAGVSVSTLVGDTVFSASVQHLDNGPETERVLRRLGGMAANRLGG